MFQRVGQISLFLAAVCSLVAGCQKLHDEPYTSTPVTIPENPPPAEVSDPPAPALPPGAFVAETLTDGNTVGVINDGRFTAHGLQLQGNDGFIQYRIPSTPRGYVEFNAAGFIPNERDGGGEFKAVLLTMWSGSDGYSYESAPFIFELRKFGHIPGRPDATDSLSFRIKSHGTWKVGQYHVLSWDSRVRYHFRVEWGGGQATVLRDGQVVATGTYRAEFQPSNHHVQIGAQPLRHKEAPHNLLISHVVIGRR